jgi:hypothetical protein
MVSPPQLLCNPALETFSTVDGLGSLRAAIEQRISLLLDNTEQTAGTDHDRFRNYLRWFLLALIDDLKRHQATQTTNQSKSLSQKKNTDLKPPKC